MALGGLVQDSEPETDKGIHRCLRGWSILGRRQDVCFSSVEK